MFDEGRRHPGTVRWRRAGGKAHLGALARAGSKRIVGVTPGDGPLPPPCVQGGGTLPPPVPGAAGVDISGGLAPA